MPGKGMREEGTVVLESQEGSICPELSSSSLKQHRRCHPGERRRQPRPKHGEEEVAGMSRHIQTELRLFFLLKNLKQTRQKVQVLLQLDSGYIVKLFCFSAWLKTL